MPIRPFLLERYFAAHEFETEHLLSSSDCETATVREVLERGGVSVDELASLALRYTEPAGTRALREAVAARHLGFGPEHVVCGAPQELLGLALAALAQPGTRVVVQTPCYQALLDTPRAAGAEVVPWPAREGPGGWSYDVDEVCEHLEAGAAGVVMSFPHNPTGALLSRADFERVVALAHDRGAWLFSDEMYRGLERSDDDRLPSAAELSTTAVALSGLSKGPGMPGLRVGWLLTRDDVARERVLIAKDFTTICGAGPSELIAAAAARELDHWLSRSRAIIAANIALCDDQLGRSGLAEWRAPRAGPVVLVGVRGSATKVAEEALRAGVLLVPAPLFEAGDRHVRLGLGKTSFAAGLAAWTAVLRRG